MEALLTLLSSLVSAIDASAPDIADAFRVTTNLLRERWNQIECELEDLRVKVSGLREEVRELEDLRAQYVDEIKRLSCFANPSIMWRVIFDTSFLTSHKITSIKAHRVVCGLGLKETKELVESKAKKNEQLFVDNLSTTEFLSALEALVDSSNPIPLDRISIEKIHSKESE